MYCEKCGHKCPKRSEFCPHCGMRLKKKTKKRKKGGCAITFFSMMVILAAIVIGILYFFPEILSFIEIDSSSESEAYSANGDVEIPEEYQVTPPDAESYYENNATVKDITQAGDSKSVLTEAEVYEFLTMRGFAEDTVTSMYTMDGEYYEAAEISETSDEKHPIYETYYFTANDDMWIISVINDTIMATPVSYNIQSELSVQVLIAEDDVITSYDSTTNKFFDTIPNEDALLVVMVEKLDAETLDGLTIEEIDRRVK